MAQATVRDFRCNGCGTPLKIPNNSKGQVTCPSCKTESIIEGLVKNAEMAAKENIASGVPLTATTSTLHRYLVHFISDTTGMPQDVFQESVVVREEHHCVAAFLFYGSGSSSYTYEASKQTQQEVITGYDEKLFGGLKAKTKTVKQTEWVPMSGTANASGEVVASGNKDFRETVQRLYANLDHNRLHDYDELVFPHDVETHSYNVPETAAFNEYGHPQIEQLIKLNAVKLHEGKMIQNLTLGGCSIKKDEAVRVFLGMYRVVLDYKGTEYYVWVAGDGRDAITDGMPVDEVQFEAIRQKKQDMEDSVAAVPIPNAGKFTAGFWGSIVGGVILAFVGIGFFGLVLGAIGAVVFHYLEKNMMKPYHGRIAHIRSQFQTEIDNMQRAAKDAAERFKFEKQPLRGIYEQEVAGDPSAF